MEFRVLGPLEVLEDGRALDLGGPRQRSLLAILLTRAGQVMAADRLIEELWHGAPPNTASTALRVHVTHLRAVLEPDRPRSSPSVRLPATPPGYRLAVEPDELDAQRFERAAVLGRTELAEGRASEAADLLGGALSLWRGAAFADTSRHPVVELEAMRLEELRLTTLEELMEARLALGHHVALVDQLVAAAHDHPLRERFTGQLMLALYQCGRQAEALRAMSRLRQQLRDDLGLEPSPALIALEQDILLQRPELNPPEARASGGATWTSSPPMRGPSLIGRHHELDVLRRTFAAVVQGDVRAVFVGGAPGVGKTALAQAFAEEAASAGATVVRGRCEPDPVGPYQPFREALRALVRVHPLRPPVDPLTAEIGVLVPELAPELASSRWRLDDHGDMDRHRLFESVVSVLRGVREPVVLILDDVHWADVPSTLLLRHLVRHDDPGRTLVVATYRDADVGPSDPLNRAMNRLVREERAERLVLPGLSREEVDQLVRRTAPPDVLPRALELADQLHRFTGGNPFFVKEVLERLAELGDDVPVDDLGRLVPPAVQDLVGERLGQLSGTAAAVLRTAAVAGQEFDLELVAQSVDLSVDEVLEAVEEGLGARVVEEAGAGVDRFAFVHELVRSVIYGAMAGSRRRRVHRRIGEALELASDREDRISELAHHFLEAAETGVALKAARYACDAAESALARTAFEDAADLCHRGLAVLAAEAAGGRDPLAAECDLLIQLGRAERHAALVEARATLLRAFEVARNLGDADRMAAAVLSTNRGFFARMGRPDDELIASLEMALDARPPGDDSVTAELLAVLASELVWADDGERRFEISDRSLAMARRLGDARTLARVLLLRNLTISTPDTLLTRVEECRELVDLAERLRDPVIRFLAAFHQSGTAQEARETDVADALVADAAEIAVELRQPSLLWISAFMRTGAAIGRGRLAEAEALAEEALVLGQRANQGADAFMFYSEQLLEIRRWQGRLSDVRQLFEDLAGTEHDFGFVLLRYLYDAGAPQAVRERYEASAERTRLPPRRDLVALPTLCNLAHVAAGLVDTSRLVFLYDALLPYAEEVSKTTVSHFVGHHELGLLAQSMGEETRAEHHLARAIAVHDSMGTPLLTAESRLEWASLQARRGRDDAAVRRAVQQVRATAAESGAHHLTRRCDQLDGSGTPPERRRPVASSG